MEYREIISELKKHSNPENVAGMARFGINPENTLGVSVPVLRGLAKKIGKDHRLALKLWKSNIHEARILASMVDDVGKVDAKQVDRWISDFDSWDVCDQVMMNLFWMLPDAPELAVKYARTDGEFTKRAGFALMAVFAWKNKGADDKLFDPFLAEIISASSDVRNYVKKSVNWALRQIGKRNARLNRKAVAASEKILAKGDKSSMWIANDALRELKGEAVVKKLGIK
ncbi:MAG: DNA alkylation repair protein [Candidatus Altiarchaeota archaeon]|nr:DNA alkylation repair protein [Candidatus Altiarchaeota archaeon]